MASNNELLSVSNTLEQQDRKIAAIDEKLDTVNEKLELLKNTVEAQTSHHKDISSRVNSIVETLGKLQISSPAAAVEEHSQGSLNPVFEGYDEAEEGGDMGPANGELPYSFFFKSFESLQQHEKELI